MIELSKDKIIERFRSYVALDTASDDKSETSPSTAKQLKLAKLLKSELSGLGLEDVVRTEYGYVLAALPANTNEKLPVIGLLAHMDTSNEASGANIKMQVHSAYDGSELDLGKGVKLSPKDFPELKNYLGQELITSNGTTLLGADDKAGVCAIVSACEYLLAHPEIKHGKILLAFTPDEEIGMGPAHFNVKKFGADFAYTLDGDTEGEIQYENFNAARAVVEFTGVNVHPGSSKNTMVNAALVAMEFNSMLPSADTPRDTEDYEGFFHLYSIKGDVSHAALEYIIRDHDATSFDIRKKTMKHITKILNEKWGKGTVSLTITEQYRNMKEIIDTCMELIERATAACKECNIPPLITPIRGGTDGAQLSFMGLPCPNLGTGGHAYHGPYEHITVEGMNIAVEVGLKIIELFYK